MQSDKYAAISEECLVDYLLNNVDEIFRGRTQVKEMADVPYPTPRAPAPSNKRKTSLRVIYKRIQDMAGEIDGNGYPCDTCGAQCKKDNKHGDMVCPDCGLCHTDNIYNDAAYSMNFEAYGALKSTVDAHTRKNFYKRVNYFTELMKNLTDTRHDNVPEAVMAVVSEQCNKWNTKRSEITVSDVRKLLRKHKLGKYYPYVNSIHRTVAGKKASVSLTHHDITRMTEMFNRASMVYDKMHTNRKNGLNYSYTTMQLLRLIGRQDCCQFVNGLKCKKRIKCHDEIWKDICQCLEYPFMPMQ